MTLDQMVPDSAFLRDLYASPDPKVPYFLIAGNTSLIPVSAGDKERRPKRSRLADRLWSGRITYDASDLFFDGLENDIAVLLASMLQIDGGREPTCSVRTVARDHISYFWNPVGVRKLAKRSCPIGRP